MLQLPVISNAWIVVSDPALISGVVGAVSDVDQNGRFFADDLVTMRDARRNNNLPWTKRTDI